jgi:flavin reductase (DIM6/NTAB) family NADH-FMN oxidoreductase RutF
MEMESKIWSSDDLGNLERRYRGNLINSIGGFKPLMLLGTQSLQGNNNLAIFSSYFHVGADPALCGIVIRPSEPGENTLGNIMDNGHFTLNHVLPEFYEKAHQCSAKYPQGVSEFDAVGLTPQWREGVRAPFVKESRVKMACQLEEKINVHLNGTIIIIGRMIHLESPEECLMTDGSIDLEMAQSVTCSGLETYHVTRKLGKLPYAKFNV